MKKLITNIPSSRCFRNLLVIVWLSITYRAHAQSTQLWADYTLNLPFSNSYLFSSEFSYHTIISKESKWREVEINPIIQWSIDRHIDVLFSLKVSSTLQREDYNSDELRPALGMRYHFTPQRRVQLRGLLQVEQRNLYHQESSTWAHSLRTRFRVESLIPINKKTIFENRLLYGLIDAEIFWVLDKQLDERYANQLRFRAGMGYRSSYTWRFEVIYTDQYSRNNLEQGFQQVSNIFRVRIKHFLNKAKPATHDPNHN
ncbi:MAG TPA: DUF2490 domain-containing protein [Ohtaekwangia sp.]